MATLGWASLECQVAKESGLQTTIFTTRILFRLFIGTNLEIEQEDGQ